MERKKLARLLKLAAVVAVVYAAGAWTFSWRLDDGPKWGVMDRAGALIVSPQYEDMGPAYNGLVPVKIGGRWGLIDAAGKVVLEPKYGRMDWSGSGWKVRKEDDDAYGFWNARYGWVDGTGKLVVAPEYRTVLREAVGWEKDGAWTLRDEKGKLTVTRDPGSIGEFAHGLAVAGEFKRSVGVIDRRGNWLIPRRFTRAYICGANCVAGNEGGRWRFYDRNGKPLSAAAYESLTELGQGFFQASPSQGKSVIVNAGRGRPVELPFDDMRSFSQNRAAVKSRGKWGYVDAGGSVVIRPAYDEARAFREGVAPVRQGKLWHLIDATGMKVGTQSYEMIAGPSRGLSFVSTGDKHGYIDNAGNVLFEFGEAWLHLVDASGKRVGRPILSQSVGSYSPGVVSATALAVADYPPHVHVGATVFSFGVGHWIANLDTLAMTGLALAIACAIGAFLAGPAPAARFRNGVATAWGWAGAAARSTATRTTGRRIGKTVLYAVAVVFALAVLVLLINAFDEELRPEVAAYLKESDAKVPDAKNGYYYAVGLSAKSGAPHAVGMQYVAQVEDVQAKRINGETAPWPGFESFSYKDPGLCNMESGGCLERVGRNEKEARRILAENKLLLERYRALADYPIYLETQRLLLIDAPLPSYQAVSNAQRLLFIDAALRVRDGQVAAALAEVEKSLTFSRRMLAGSRSMIGKMVAAAQVHRAALFASEILAARRAAPGATVLGDALQPLTDEERLLAEALRAEFNGMFGPAAAQQACRQGQLYAFADADGPGGSWLSAAPCALFKTNATLNRQYFTWHKPFIEIDAAPAEKFDEARQRLRPPARDIPWLTMLYNPVGKLLGAVSNPDWSDYTASMHDRDALLRLVALHALIVGKRAANADVPKLVAQAGKRYADPYTGAPMKWDAERRQLYFEPRSTRMKKLATGGRFGITL